MGCDNENAFDCIKKRGDETSQTIPTDPISTIFVYDGINLTLEESNESSVTITTGKNLINKIEVTTVNDTLYLRDNNSCNWVRNYENIEVKVAVPPRTLELIEQNGYGSIQSSSIINVESFRLSVFENSEDIDLEMDGQYILIVSAAINTVRIKGRADNFLIGSFNDVGVVDATEMTADVIDFNHEGGNNIIVNPKMILTGTIKSTGNVYYSQLPDSISVETNGSGKLLPLKP